MEKINRVIDEIIDWAWFTPIKKGYILECCKCGLRHRINFRIRKGIIEIQAFRLNKKEAAKYGYST